MSAEIKDAVQQVINHPQVAAYTSVATVTTSLASILGGLQGALSIVASVVGIVLSVILCITHWRKGVLERKVLELEIAQLKQEIGK